MNGNLKIKVKEFLANAGKLKLDAEVILSKMLKVDKSFLFAHPDFEVPEKATFLLEERKKGKPLAYVLGEKEFYGRKLIVDEAVLIPRPETEVVVEMALERINGFSLEDGQFVTVIDVGTGSGAIGLTLDLEAKKPVNVIGLDNSPEALEVAERNCNEFGSKMRLMESDLLEVFEGRIETNGGLVMVANLPYVDSSWDWLSPELKYEPANALFAENGGLQVIFDLLDQVAEKVEEGVIILEADPCQHTKIREYAEKLGLKFVRIKGFGVEFEKKV